MRILRLLAHSKFFSIALTQQSENFSSGLHDPMTRKHLPRRAVERGCGEPCIDGGVLDVGMSQPILHKGQVSARIK
jgi:hypothetical protein